MRFENQVAIVTGAGRGIGQAISLRLANEGARVACVSRTEVNAKNIANQINAIRADTGRAYTVDVADHAAVHKIGAQILEDFGRADILINNAGVTRDVLAMRMSLEDWDSVVNTNLRGAFSFAQAFIRADKLCGEQSGFGRSYQITRSRAGEPQYHRKRRSAGIHHDRHDRRAFR